MRKRFFERVTESHGEKAAEAAEVTLGQSLTCYAAKQHLNKGANILDREGILPGRDKPREVKSGYAPIFEQVTKFLGRAWKGAVLQDLLGCYNEMTPWKDGLPRMIFISDMGDAMSAKSDFPFLKADLMPAIESTEGKRHLWLWLTNRAGRMAEFADEIGGFPENVCAMTTLTGPDEESLKRLADLKLVKASIRGLSIEPLWERIPPSKLNLAGIDWVIVGGESGSGELTRPFALEWADEIREHCQKNGVAYFLKQLGRNPSSEGRLFKLKDKHGGDWNEWDEALRIREFPRAFHDYRKGELTISDKLRPMSKKKEKRLALDPAITPEEIAQFKHQHLIVKKGVRAFAEVGLALAAIKEGKLWRAGVHETWEGYCRSVAGISRIHAHRMIEAAGLIEIFKTLPRGNVLPQMEAQVRPLLRLPEWEQRVAVWGTAVEQADGGQPTAPAVIKLVFEVLHPEGPGEQLPSRSQRRVECVIRFKEGVGYGNNELPVAHVSLFKIHPRKARGPDRLPFCSTRPQRLPPACRPRRFRRPDRRLPDRGR